MNYLIIKNLFNDGNPDYKGLDIMQLEQPIYDTGNNTCAMVYTGDVSSLHEDVTLTDETGYTGYKDSIVVPPTLEQRLKDLEEITNQMLLGGL